MGMGMGMGLRRIMRQAERDSRGAATKNLLQSGRWVPKLRGAVAFNQLSPWACGAFHLGLPW